MMLVLIDTNILLDMLLRRHPWWIEADAIWEAVRRGRMEGLVSATTITDVYYIVRRAAGATAATAAVRTCVQLFTVVEVGKKELDRAIERDGADFEDDVQIAVAVSARADAIVTRDVTGFAGSPVEVLLPAQLLSRLT